MSAVAEAYASKQPLRPQVHCAPPHADDHVAEFRARRTEALKEFPVDDHAAAHARAERDEYDGSVFAPRAAPGFAQRRRVRVVGHKRADPEIFFDLRAQRNVVPGNVVAVIDDAVFAVYCPRRTDADRRDVGHGYVRVRRDLSHEPRHVGGDFAVRRSLPVGILSARTIAPVSSTIPPLTNVPPRSKPA